MIRRRAALTIASLFAASSLVAPLPAGAQARTSAPPYGAPGIGDPYFPLDGNGGIDVQRYDIHDRYDFASRRLSGWTRVTLRATQKLSGFDLDFLLPVTSVTAGGDDVRYGQSGHQHHELRISRRVHAGEQLSLVIRYAGKPGAYSYGGESNWLADRHEVVAMNQPHMAPWWFPSNDHPLDKALVDVHITAPKQDQVVSNGFRRGREVHGDEATTHWSADEPMVPYLAFFAAGPFQVAHGTHDGLPWYVAVSKQLNDSSQHAAMRLMLRTPTLLSWLETKLGPYPFSTTGGLTTSLDPGFALENQTRPTYPLWLGPDGVTTVVHELTHQWFGDSVAVHHWKDIWLNEGFATFMEKVYAADHGGPSAGAWLRDTYRGSPEVTGFWQHQVADPCPDHVDCEGPIFADWVYDRGAMALQALRNVIGDDDVFWQLLRTWATDHAGGNGATGQFEALAEQVTGLDLGAFFDAWLHTADKPADTAANGLG